MKKLLCLITSCIFGALSYGQNVKEISQDLIQVAARVTEDSVVLRWAPDNFIRWRELNRTGYAVYRSEVNEKTDNSPGIRLKPDTIRPWALERWKSSFPANHAYAPIAVQALFGNEFGINSASGSSANLGDMYGLSNEQEMRWAFALFTADMDPATAAALGLRLVDKTVEKGKKYVYNIVPLQNAKIRSGSVIVNAGVPDELPVPPSPKAYEHEKNIFLEWDFEDFRTHYIGYWVERSADMGRTWYRLNAAPLVRFQKDNEKNNLVFYADTLIEALYKPYQYRLRGITSFGEVGRDAGPVVQAMARDFTAPPAPIIKEALANNGPLIINWNYDSQIPTDFKGFYVGYSETAEGDFQIINQIPLASGMRSYTIQNEWVRPLFYKVFAEDTAGNRSSSLAAYSYRKDSIPPMVPRRFMGKIDTTGKVTLSWNKGAEKDIYGYRIYVANAPEHHFSVLTSVPVRDTVFVDSLSLNTLTRRIYYKISALDYNFNHSKPSEMLILLKPDTVRPSAPLISSYLISDTAVWFKIVESSASDVSRHIMLRKAEGSTTWEEVGVWFSGQKRTDFKDDKLSAGKGFTYSIVAEDSAGNRSHRVSELHIKGLQNLKKKTVPGFNATYNRVSNSVHLSWDNPDEVVKYYVIYRQKGDFRLAPLCSVPAGETFYADVAITGPNLYAYYIKAVYQSGKESEVTGPVNLNTSE